METLWKKIGTLSVHVSAQMEIRRLIKINDAATQRRDVNIYRRKSFLEFDYCNNGLKLVLVTCKQFCSPKRFGVCY